MNKYYDKLIRLKNESLKELASIGVKEYLGTIEKYEVNTRAKSRLGVCRRRRSMGYIYNTIGVSDWVLEKFSDKDIKNTIIHELLHTIEGCNNHGRKWQQYARLVNRELGYNIKTYANLQKLCADNGIDYSEFENNSYKYEITCKKCGAVWHKHRLTARHIIYYKHGSMSHRGCGGKEFIVKDIKLGKVIVDNDISNM